MERGREELLVDQCCKYCHFDMIGGHNISLCHSFDEYFFVQLQGPNTKDFKMKFWSNDDAPIIRPLLKTEPSSMPRTEISMGVNSHKPDGYGGIACERVTKISGRTSKQWLAGYAVLILGAAGLSAALLKFKQTKKSLN